MVAFPSFQPWGGWISYPLLGLLSLAGVIINNGIVLIDKIDADRAEGREPYSAVLNAALSRFRPILMTTVTTVTTVLGLMQPILSVDPLFFSMAVILAFVGLTFYGDGGGDCATCGGLRICSGVRCERVP